MTTRNTVQEVVSREDKAGLILRQFANDVILLQSIAGKASFFANTNLQVGMRILYLNGLSTTGLTVEYAMDLLREGDDAVVVVAQEFDPENPSGNDDAASVISSLSSRSVSPKLPSPIVATEVHHHRHHATTENPTASNEDAAAVIMRKLVQRNHNPDPLGVQSVISGLTSTTPQGRPVAGAVVATELHHHGHHASHHHGHHASLQNPTAGNEDVAVIMRKPVQNHYNRDPLDAESVITSHSSATPQARPVSGAVLATEVHHHHHRHHHATTELHQSRHRVRAAPDPDAVSLCSEQANGAVQEEQEEAMEDKEEPTLIVVPEDRVHAASPKPDPDGEMMRFGSRRILTTTWQEDSKLLPSFAVAKAIPEVAEEDEDEEEEEEEEVEKKADRRDRRKEKSKDDETTATEADDDDDSFHIGNQVPSRELVRGDAAQSYHTVVESSTRSFMPVSSLSVFESSTSLPVSSSVTATARKPDPDCPVGLRLLQSRRGGILIDIIKNDSIFAGTALRTGMILVSINGQDCSLCTVDEAVGLFRKARRNVTIVAHMADDDDDKEAEQQEPPKQDKKQQEPMPTPRNGNGNGNGCHLVQHNDDDTYSKERYLDIARAMEQNLDIRNRMYHLKTYKNCFVGSEAVDFLLEHLGLPNRQKAVQVGRQMNSAIQCLEHVVHDHDDQLKDEYLFYRFTTNYHANHEDKEKPSVVVSRYNHPKNSFWPTPAPELIPLTFGDPLINTIITKPNVEVPVGLTIGDCKTNDGRTVPVIVRKKTNSICNNTPLQTGMRILCIDGLSCESRDDAQALLHSGHGSISIVAGPIDQTVAVTITKPMRRTTVGIALKLLEGVGMMVSSISPSDLLASTDLKPGMRILLINGISTEHMNCKQAISIIRDAEDHVTIVAERLPDCGASSCADTASCADTTAMSEVTAVMANKSTRFHCSEASTTSSVTSMGNHSQTITFAPPPGATPGGVWGNGSYCSTKRNTVGRLLGKIGLRKTYHQRALYKSPSGHIYNKRGKRVGLAAANTTTAATQQKQFLPTNPPRTTGSF